MSTVFLHVGQCGNQLGQAFWSEVEKWQSAGNKKRGIQSTQTPPSSSKSSLSHPPPPPPPPRPSSTKLHAPLPYSLLDGTLPCVLVDTEPKVIRQCCKTGILARRVPNEFRISERSGRGNNWAYGYYGRENRSTHGLIMGVGGDLGGCYEKGQSLADLVLERVRKTVEKCDRFSGTVLFHSIAGGTGSGLGSAIMENLRDEHPLAYILSVPVAPFSSGETPLQHYNALLCLHWLQSYCDAVMLFQNDSVLLQAERTAKMVAGGGASGGTRFGTGGGGGGRSHGDSVSLWDMNKHVGETLCGSLLPVLSAERKKMTGTQVHSCMEPWELVRSLCPDPTLKFITPVHTTVSGPGSTWDQSHSRVTHPSVLRRADPAKGKAVTSALVAISRSSPTNMDTLIPTVGSLERRLKQAYNTVKWNPFPVDFWMSYEPNLGDRKVSTVLANSSIVGEYLDSVVQRATAMYKQKAYLHWYERHHCSVEVFEESFEGVHSIMDAYAQLQ